MSKDNLCEELEKIQANPKVSKLKNAFEQMFARMQQLSADCMGVSSGELSKKDLMVIDFVGKQQSCIMRDIAEFLNAPVSTLTSMIDKLVRKRQLFRERSDEDRRIVKVMLGEKGEITYNEFEASKLIMSQTMLTALSEQEQDEFIRLMEKISTHSKKI